MLEWVAISFSRGSSLPRNQTRVSCIAGGFFTNWATGKPCSRDEGYSWAHVMGSLKMLWQLPLPSVWHVNIRAWCWVLDNTEEAVVAGLLHLIPWMGRRFILLGSVHVLKVCLPSLPHSFSASPAHGVSDFSWKPVNHVVNQGPR